MTAPQQYESAKQDFEYFLRLLDLALAYRHDWVEDGAGAPVDE